MAGMGWSWLSHGVCLGQHRSEGRDPCHGPACPAVYMRNPLWPAMWGPLTQTPVWTGALNGPEGLILCVDFSESTVRLRSTGREDLVGLIVHRVKVMGGSEAQNPCGQRWCK